MGANFSHKAYFSFALSKIEISFFRPHAAVTCVVSRFNEFSSRYTNDTCYWFCPVGRGRIRGELTIPTFDVNNNQLCTDWNWINLIIYFQCRRWWLHIGLSTFISCNLNMCTMIWWLMLFSVSCLNAYCIYIYIGIIIIVDDVGVEITYRIRDWICFFFCCVMKNMLSWQRKFERESQCSDMSRKGIRILLTQLLNLERQTHNLCNVNNRRHIPSTTARCFQVFSLLFSSLSFRKLSKGRVIGFRSLKRSLRHGEVDEEARTSKHTDW